MNWEVRISRTSARYLTRIEKKKNQILRQVLTGFQENPFVGDIKPIKGRSNTYRRRIGVYRIIYSIDYEMHVVKVLKIGTRGDVYK